MALPLDLPAERDPGYDEGGDWGRRLVEAVQALNDGKVDLQAFNQALQDLQQSSGGGSGKPSIIVKNEVTGTWPVTPAPNDPTVYIWFGTLDANGQGPAGARVDRTINGVFMSTDVFWIKR